jgi:hypothetical protein
MTDAEILRELFGVHATEELIIELSASDGPIVVVESKDLLIEVDLPTRTLMFTPYTMKGFRIVMNGHAEAGRGSRLRQTWLQSGDPPTAGMPSSNGEPGGLNEIHVYLHELVSGRSFETFIKDAERIAR